MSGSAVGSWERRHHDQPNQEDLNREQADHGQEWVERQAEVDR
jgi:hypothetical protein